RRHTRFSRDWSSDVCSSDLRVLDAAERHLGAGHDAARIGEVLVEAGLVPDEARFLHRLAEVEAGDGRGLVAPDTGQRRADAVLEIGRASGREVANGGVVAVG